MKLAVIIGRFQPLHIGHISLIDKAYQEADKVLILIGSSKQLPDFKNPFTFEERRALIRDTIGEDYDTTIRPLPDCPSDDEWVSNVVGEVISIEEDPTEVTIFCNPKDEGFYREHFLFPVETLNDVPISATQVRHAWYTDTLWTAEEYLTENVLVFLEEHHDRERLAKEYQSVVSSSITKKQGHPFGNPIEPVSFGVIIQDGKVLLGRRGAPRGNGQLGLPGGYVERKETTLDGCLRETKEELGIDLKLLIQKGQAKCLAQAVEENMNDLGTRTIGINYLFVIHEDVELEVTVDGEETTEYKWVSLVDLAEDRELLFFNHNTIIKRLLTKMSTMGGSND